jgi:hypothetical protein
VSDLIVSSAYTISGDTITFNQNFATSGGLHAGSRILHNGNYYYYDPASNSFVNASGRRLIVNVDFTTSFDPARLTPLGLPSEIRGVPQNVWSRPRTSVGSWPLSMHIDQMRWAIAEIYITTGNTEYEIPMLDSNDRPWFSPDTPPLVTCRRATTGTDYVKAAYTNGIPWFDVRTNLRPTPLVTAASIGVYWRLARRDTPVPHWVIKLQAFYNASSTTLTVRFDLLGGGGHTHASSSREVGSAGVDGHWNVKLPWTQQAFDAAGSASVLNERAYGLGAVDVTNDPGTITTPGYLYLTTGVNQGLPAGTSLFGSELPMVMVLAHKLAGAANLVAGAAESSWIPESFGWGWHDDQYTNETNELNSFDSLVETSAGVIRVGVHNSSDSSGINVADANLDRTYFVYAIGKAA